MPWFIWLLFVSIVFSTISILLRPKKPTEEGEPLPILWGELNQTESTVNYTDEPIYPIHWKAKPLDLPKPIQNYDDIKPAKRERLK